MGYHHFKTYNSYYDVVHNSPAVKTCGPKEGYFEKFKIQNGGQEMAVIVGQFR